MVLRRHAHCSHKAVPPIDGTKSFQKPNLECRKIALNTSPQKSGTVMIRGTVNFGECYTVRLSRDDPTEQLIAKCFLATNLCRY